MKLKELKHNHSLTDLLKVLIFSILMITPLLSVATRCLYVICNKNAYHSYYGETINETNTVQVNEENFSLNRRYTMSFSQIHITANNVYEIRLLDIISYSNTTEADNIRSEIDNINGLSLTNDRISFMANGIEVQGLNPFYRSGVFEFDILTGSYTNALDNLLSYIEYNSYSYLDNVFEYSVNKLSQSPILSWTQQTAIYTGVNTMTTQLGVNTPTIPMLIVYWFLLTVIYIIIDIIIKLFTWLTHMIGSKSV